MSGLWGTSPPAGWAWGRHDRLKLQKSPIPPVPSLSAQPPERQFSLGGLTPQGMTGAAALVAWVGLGVPSRVSSNQAGRLPCWAVSQQPRALAIDGKSMESSQALLGTSEPHRRRWRRVAGKPGQLLLASRAEQSPALDWRSDGVGRAACQLHVEWGTILITADTAVRNRLPEEHGDHWAWKVGAR